MSHATSPGGERRIVHANLRVVRDAAPERADGDEGEPGPAPADRIVGHASVFDQWTTLYDGRHCKLREVVRPGAYRNAIAEGQDVRSLFNHDPNFILGRTKSGTLTLTEDAKGLLSDTTPPDTQTVRDMVLIPMERGDIDGMSFAFSIRRGDRVVTTENADGSTTIDAGGERITERYDENDCLIMEREILDADLFDVSPVVYPAYDGTDVALRSIGSAIESRAKEMDRPRVRPAPLRDQYRRRLDEAAALPARPDA